MTSGKPKRASAPGIPAFAGTRPVSTPHPSSRTSRHRSDWRLVAAIVAGGIAIVGTGTAVLFSERHKDKFAITTTKPAEVIRFETRKPRLDSVIHHFGADPPKQDSVIVPPPVGTINRMNAIRGAFSK